MTPPRDIDRLLDQWFSDGPTEVPDRVIDVVADRIERQPQRPAWRFHWREIHVHTYLKPVTLVAAIAIVAVAGFSLVDRSASVQPPPSATPTPTETGSPRPSASQRIAATSTPLVGTGLVVFEHSTPRLLTRLEYLLPDLRGKELLPDVPGVQETPTWSPDGTRLAFAGFDPRDPASHEAIWETDSTGTKPRLISTDCKPPVCLEESDPAYSPDGSSLAFIRWSGPAGGPPTSSVVAIRDLTIGSVRELEPTRRPAAKADNRHPRWSPDGTRLVYHAVLWGADGRATDSIVFVIGTDGTGLQRLSPTDFPAGDAEWSPDGSRILFGSQPIHAYWGNNGAGDLSKLHVYTIAPDGSDLRQLDADGRAGSPSWAANGAQILFTLITEDQGGRGVPNVNVMEGDGSNPRFVVKFGDCCRWYPVQQPTP